MIFLNSIDLAFVLFLEILYMFVILGENEYNIEYKKMNVLLINFYIFMLFKSFFLSIKICESIGWGLGTERMVLSIFESRDIYVV